MIDRAALLATLKPLVVELEDSIRDRVVETPAVAEHLEHEHQRAVVAGRTAMSLEEWRDGEITQAAVAWVLGCVFVRFLEDNGLIDQALISGPGGRRAVALGHREEHFRAYPSHSDREYLEDCFREVAKYPAVAPLYDERHNPLWRLGPTADGARILRETFTTIDPASGALVHDFADPEFDTRFLGDLYQDLSEAAKKRYALLQTPDFVERFILDRTLTPAIDEFGLPEVRLIDPTCGSGHFLIGAFDRLFPLWREREPATAATVLAQRCLDHLAGVDLNPYATAIARFRLVIVALKACGIARLAEAPAFKLNLATGDSLLHGPLPEDGATMLFDANRLRQNVAHVYESEDADQLREILGRRYHAVVGNPPYIAVQDAAQRDAYRGRYASCHGAYVLTVPFMERFFELAQVVSDGKVCAGFVGKITGNNFMKREFGAPLVDRFLSAVDVHVLIDASGAYIPGHGTPTVLLFGRSRAPMGSHLRVVDGIRGEPRQPADPARGLVWASIESLVDQPGSANTFIRCGDVARTELLRHPLTLGAGRSLRKRLEASNSRRVGSLVADSGFAAVTREDDVYQLPAHVARARRVPANQTTALVSGDEVRDWAIGTRRGSLWPYDPETLDAHGSTPLIRFLWPWKRQLSERVAYGRTQLERGLSWFEYSMFFAGRHGGLTITWAAVATHNNFALDRAGRVFKQAAPVLKLPPGSTEERHLELLSALNSSVACFWIKQVCQDKGVGGIGGGIGDEAWEPRYDVNAGNVLECPLPARRGVELARLLDDLAASRGALDDSVADATQPGPLQEKLAGLRQLDVELTKRLVSAQEELDWDALAAYGIVPDDLPRFGDKAPPIELGQRAFEIVLARQVAGGETETTWFERHSSTPMTEIPLDWPDDYRSVVQGRIELIESDPDVGLIERPEHKRRWNRRPWEDRQRETLTRMVLDTLEDIDLWSDLQPRSTNELTDWVRRTPLIVEALDLLAERKDADIATTLRRLVLDTAVPHLAAQQLTDKGMAKLAVWERVWDLQRADDCGEDVEIPVPPGYARADFRNAIFWKHRGKLNVPKERFILVPFAERGADSSPVVGWAGWDESDLARALAGRITELRQEHAADVGKLLPLLAGVLELLPWIHQWHPDSDPLFGGPPGTFFEGWLDGELASLGVTRETLRAWRPPTPTRGRKATASTT